MQLLLIALFERPRPNSTQPLAVTTAAGLPAAVCTMVGAGAVTVDMVIAGLQLSLLL